MLESLTPIQKVMKTGLPASLVVRPWLPRSVSMLPSVAAGALLPSLVALIAFTAQKLTNQTCFNQRKQKVQQGESFTFLGPCRSGRLRLLVLYLSNAPSPNTAAAATRRWLAPCCRRSFLWFGSCFWFLLTCRFWKPFIGRPHSSRRSLLRDVSDYFFNIKI